MNKYIRKCLIVYTSLALILVGMAGAAYAITATDADQYVTRSQYAVDMAHLQNKLDEAEAGLMGNINRYRSTNVKFVTYDSPTKQDAASSYGQGYYNGGNLYPHRPRANTQMYLLSPRTSNIVSMNSGKYLIYQLYRIYNGNYILGKVLCYSDQASNPTYFMPVARYAVPVENYPGWYVVHRLRGYQSGYHYVYFSLVKLDPNSPYNDTDLNNKTIKLRYKKDFFVNGTHDLKNITIGSVNSSFNFWQNSNMFNPFMDCYNYNQGATSTQNMTFKTSIDEGTGDYMLEITNMVPYTGPTYNNREYMCGFSYFPPCVYIPRDNVEFVIGSTVGYTDPGIGPFFPNPDSIGTGTGDDPKWRYEFVDCENGIQYWHAQMSSSNHTSVTYPVTVNTCLPIVY